MIEYWILYEWNNMYYYIKDVFFVLVCLCFVFGNILVLYYVDEDISVINIVLLLWGKNICYWCNWVYLINEWDVRVWLVWCGRLCWYKFEV